MNRDAFYLYHSRAFVYWHRILMFKKLILPNGLRIVTAPMKGTNTVTVLVVCATGSDNESRAERGISHFLEHMFFKGTKNRPNPRIIKNELDSMGSVSNAFTSHEYTGYFIKAGHIYLDAALDLLSDIYRNSLLDEKEINRERQVIVEEMHMRRDDPGGYVGEIYEELLYGTEQNAGWDVIGTEEHIRKFTPQEFRNYFKNQYTSHNTAVIVAGNFDEAPTIEKIKKHFSGIRSGNPKPKAAFSEAQSRPQVKLHFKETDQTHLLIGFRGIDAADPDRFAADMLATILGGSWSSRMWDTVRDRMGLAYTVHTSSDTYSNRGSLTTYAGIAHENLEKAVKAIMAEYKKIAEKGVSAKELKRSKDFLRGRMLLSLESSNAVANFVGLEEAVTGKPLTIEEVFQKIDALTPADIRAIAKKLIRGETLNLALIGPHKDGERLLKLLVL